MKPIACHQIFTIHTLSSSKRNHVSVMTFTYEPPSYLLWRMGIAANITNLCVHCTYHRGVPGHTVSRRCTPLSSPTGSLCQHALSPLRGASHRIVIPARCQHQQQDSTRLPFKATVQMASEQGSHWLIESRTFLIYV